MSHDLQQHQQTKKWKKIRRYASLTMIFGFVLIVLSYFFLNDFYQILAVWFFTVIVPHIIHTWASRNLKRLKES